MDPLLPPTGPPVSGSPLPPPPPSSGPAAPPRAKGGGLRAGLIGGLAGALVAGGVAYGTVQLTDDEPVAAPPPTVVAGQPTDAAPTGELDIRALLARVGPSVVSIEIGAAGLGGVQQVGAGSGVVISADGLVLTNEHVITGADTITVKFSDGKAVKADLVGSSPENDIALVRMRDASGLTPVVLGDSSTLQVGDEVVAIGNALDLGDSPTVTRGIVSAKGRMLESGEVRLENLIQTDAAINRGNSGGPLLNTAGEVVGINSAGIPSGQNLGFAIDINVVKPLIEKLKNGNVGVEVTAFLGVTTAVASDLEPADLDRFGLDATQAGAVVIDVQPESGADDAGLQPGDVIVGVEGERIDAGALREEIRSREPGDTIILNVLRAGDEREVEAMLGSRTVQDG
jgi:putative serine protease PepD